MPSGRWKTRARTSEAIRAEPKDWRSVTGTPRSTMPTLTFTARVL